MNYGMNVSVTVGAGGGVNGGRGMHCFLSLASTSLVYIEQFWRSTDNSCFTATSIFTQVALHRSAHFHFCRRPEATPPPTAPARRGQVPEEMEGRAVEPRRPV